MAIVLRVSESVQGHHTKAATPTVAVVDADAVTLELLQAAFAGESISFVAHASAHDFLAEPGEGGCIVANMSLPDMTGLELLETLKRVDDPRPVVVVTSRGSVRSAVAMMKLGAIDYIELPARPERLAEAVRAGLERGSRLQSELSAMQDLRDRYASLSDRQKATMQLIVNGLANKEVAARLGISPRTIEIYRSSVMSKMGALSFADLVRMSIRLSS